MNNISNKLDFAVEHSLNVILRGEAGVGKTALVTQAFERANLSYKVFSASTMDPWVDLIGIPKERLRESDNAQVLSLVRPEWIYDGSVDAIFLDEYNRAPAPVRNAVMELIQFQSINGFKIPGLKMIWTAINPHDSEGTYDVDELDPAQLDRFHMQIDVPFKPHFPYLEGKYGETMARGAIEWWHNLPKDIKPLVSPRRLDYALEILQLGGPISTVLPKKCNISSLGSLAESGAISTNIEMLSAEGKYAEIAELIRGDTEFDIAFPIFRHDIDLGLKVFAHVKHRERISKYINSIARTSRAIEKILDAVKDSEALSEVVLSIVASGSKTGKRLRTVMDKDKSFAGKIASVVDVKGMLKSNDKGTYQRKKNAKKIAETYEKHLRGEPFEGDKAQACEALGIAMLIYKRTQSSAYTFVSSGTSQNPFRTHRGSAHVTEAEALRRSILGPLCAIIGTKKLPNYTPEMLDREVVHIAGYISPRLLDVLSNRELQLAIKPLVDLYLRYDV